MNAPLIVIAAGGDGSRMGGNKPLQLLAGRRLIDHAIGFAQANSDAIALALRNDSDGLDTGLPLLADPHPGIGPISALASGMAHAEAIGRETLLLIACDMPFLPDDLVMRLDQALCGHTAAMAVSQGRLHPMAGLWQPDAEGLAGYIADGGQSIWRFGQAMGMARVEWDATPDPFTNINTADDLAAAELRMSARS